MNINIEKSKKNASNNSNPIKKILKSRKPKLNKNSTKIQEVTTPNNNILNSLLLKINKNNVGNISNEIGKKIFRKIFTDIQNYNLKKNQNGVLFIKKKYSRLYEKKGVKLFDLIFSNIKELSKVNVENLKITYYHGLNNKMVSDSVTAGINGIHIYTTKSKILGIVLRNNI